MISKLILCLVAFLLIVIFTPIVFFGTIVKFVITLDINRLTLYFYKVATSLDQFGNVVAEILFNHFLITSSGYSFGNPDETVSSVLGKNKLQNSLTRLGKMLDAVLNVFEKNHSTKSIETNP